MNALEIIKQYGLGGLAMMTVVFAALFVAPRLNALMADLQTLSRETDRTVHEVRLEILRIKGRLALLEKRTQTSPETLRAQQDMTRRLDRLENHLLFSRTPPGAKHHSE